MDLPAHARTATRAPRPAPTAAAASPLYSLRPSVLWRFLMAQPASFWFVNAYVFFEYVRPQSIYKAIEGPPWAKFCIILAVLAFLVEGREIRMRTVADYCLMAFSAIVVLSSVLAFRPEASYAKLWDYFSWVLIFILISNSIRTEGQFLVLTLAFLLYNFKMSQSATRSWASEGFAFRNWGTSGAPGWFSNSGEFAIEMVMFIPIAVFFAVGLRRHWHWLTFAVFVAMALTAVIAILGSSSRGGMLGGAVVVLLMVLTTRYKVRGLVLAAALALFVKVMLPPEQTERFETMGDDQTSTARIVYWKYGLKVMEDHPVLGIGYSNWADYWERDHGYRALPHNIFIEAGAELGYVGLAGFGALIVATLLVNARTRKRLRPLGERGLFLSQMAHALDIAMVGYLVGGLFVTVLYYPFFWINLAMTVALYNAAESVALARRPAAPSAAPPPVQPRPRGRGGLAVAPALFPGRGA
jgi:O-antigen ligase